MQHKAMMMFNKGTERKLSIHTSIPCSLKQCGLPISSITIVQNAGNKPFQWSQTKSFDSSDLLRIIIQVALLVNCKTATTSLNIIPQILLPSSYNSRNHYTNKGVLSPYNKFPYLYKLYTIIHKASNGYQHFHKTSHWSMEYFKHIPLDFIS